MACAPRSPVHGPLRIWLRYRKRISSLSKRSETRRGGIYSTGDISFCEERGAVIQQTAVSVPILWLLVVAAYLLGSIPFGYLLVRMPDWQRCPR